MLTFVLTAVLLVLVVLGAEAVRSTCRRQLSTPLLAARPSAVPVAADTE